MGWGRIGPVTAAWRLARRCVPPGDSSAEMYFNGRADMRQTYIAAMEYLADLEPAAVGICMELDYYDYPVAALFWEMAGDAPRLGHIGVTNVPGFCNIGWGGSPILSDRLPYRAATLQSGFGITERPALGKTGAAARRLHHWYAPAYRATLPPAGCGFCL